MRKRRRRVSNNHIEKIKTNKKTNKTYSTEKVGLVYIKFGICNPEKFFNRLEEPNELENQLSKQANSLLRPKNQSNVSNS